MSGILIAVVVIIIFFITARNVVSYEDYLYGFWVAENDDFTEDSEISSMMLFVGRADGWFRKTRPCYLVIMDDICNQLITLKYWRGWGSPIHGKYRIHASVECTDIGIWPETVVIDIDTMRGKMRVHSDGVLLADLHKQHEITNCARAAEMAKLVE